MKAKIQKWLKETIAKLKDPMGWINTLRTASIYAIGFIFGAFHGEDFTLKDGDFIAYDTERKNMEHIP